MAQMGKYCKAYPVRRFREFSAWKENTQNLRKEKSGEEAPKKSDGDAPPLETPRALPDDDHLYLQENFTVTDGIFIDENIVFDEVTPEWVDYCKDQLKFEVPNYKTVPANSSVS